MAHLYLYYKLNENLYLMKNIIIAAFLVLLTLASNAKEKEANSADTKSSATTIITGSIADENSGESLVGVEVSIKGTNIKTYTDFDGNFKFENLKPGEYTLSTNYISYKKQLQSLNTANENKSLKIKLHTSN